LLPSELLGLGPLDGRVASLGSSRVVSSPGRTKMGITGPEASTALLVPVGLLVPVARVGAWRGVPTATPGPWTARATPEAAWLLAKVLLCIGLGRHTPGTRSHWHDGLG
jgi:hypothetical protein